MNELHVGRGTTRGGLTVFPVWSTTSSSEPVHHRRPAPRRHRVRGGPDVPTLMVGNTGDRPLLVLEGQLFEGGWQHRMATRSVLIGVHQRVPVEVACVEQGRWGGSARQASRGRRATPYVRDAVRAARPATVTSRGRCGGRVAVAHPGHRQRDRFAGPSPRRGDVRRRPTRSRCSPGQCGVLVGVGGQPMLLEVFDSLADPARRSSGRSSRRPRWTPPWRLRWRRRRAGRSASSSGWSRPGPQSPATPASPCGRRSLGGRRRLPACGGTTETCTCGRRTSGTRCWLPAVPCERGGRCD